MGVTRIFADACNIKLLKCKNVLYYTSRYQVLFDKIVSLIFKDSWMLQKTIEMTLQQSFFYYLKENYSAFVSAIKTGWTKDMTNLSDIILKVIRQAKIQKRNALNNATENPKIMITNIYQAPKRIYTTPECIEKSVTTQYNNWC